MSGPSPAGDGVVVVVDVQHSFAHPAHTPWLSDSDRSRIEHAVDRTEVLVRSARAVGTPVVWVRLVQTEDRPWTVLRRMRGVPDDAPWPGDEPCASGTDGVQWYRLRPEAGEAVVDKRYYSGFAETALHEVLTAHDPSWIAVAGLTTECCILATVFDAVQHGYRTLLVADATAAYEDADHVAATRIMLAHAATGTTVDGLLARGGTT